LPVMGDGSDSRDYTYIDDVVECFVRAATRGGVAGEAINVGGGSEVEIKDLTQAVLKLTGSKAGTVAHERRSWDHIKRRVASAGKCGKLLGFKPSTPLAQGLRKTWAWFKKENPKPI